MKSEYSATTLWFTGLPCIGKTTAANAVSRSLAKEGIETKILDSDVIAPYFKNLIQSSPEGRDIISRAMALTALHLNSSGISCLCAATTPRREIRRVHRETIPGYVEVWCKGSVETAKSRDEQRLYDMAEVGFLQGFTGVDELYEEPIEPDVVLDMAQLTPDDCAQYVVGYLKQSKYSSLFSDKNQKKATQELS